MFELTQMTNVRVLDVRTLTPAQLRAANAKGLMLVQAGALAKAGTPEKEWPFPKGGEGSGPDQKSKPPEEPSDATDAVLADVAKNGPKGAAKPATKKKPPAKKTVSKRKAAAVAH